MVHLLRPNSLIAAMAFIAMAGQLLAQPPRGPAPSREGNLAGTTGNNAAPAPVDPPEVKVNQDQLDQTIARIDRLLKERYPDYQTSKDKVAAAVASKPVATPASIPVQVAEIAKKHQAFKGVADAALQIATAKKVLGQHPDALLDLGKIVKDFDGAIDAVNQLSAENKDALAADLLMVGFKTLDRKLLIGAGPKVLLPILIKDFISQLTAGAVQQGEAPPEKPAEVKPEVKPEDKLKALNKGVDTALKKL